MSGVFVSSFIMEVRLQVSAALLAITQLGQATADQFLPFHYSFHLYLHLTPLKCCQICWASSSFSIFLLTNFILRMKS